MHHIFSSLCNTAYQLFTMKLNVKAFRYLTAEDWRVLTAVNLIPASSMPNRFSLSFRRLSRAPETMRSFLRP